MSRLSKAELMGATDRREAEVELPSIRGSVLVRSLPAAYSNQAMSDALEVVTGNRGEQTARVNTQKLEALQVLHGLVDPKLDTIEEAHAFALKVGSAWRTIVAKIDEISGIDKEAIEKTNATFQAGGAGEGQAVGNGSSPGSGAGEPDLHARAGVEAGNAGG
jgi:hypothetical protein